MEDPNTWGKVKQAISEAIMEHHRLIQDMVCGLSDVSIIYNKLAELGFVVADDNLPSSIGHLLSIQQTASEWARLTRLNKTEWEACQKCQSLPVGWCAEHSKTGDDLNDITIKLLNLFPVNESKND